jgi:hypothetical protein
MAQLWIRRIHFVERLDVSSVPFADNNFMKFVTHHCKNLKALTLWENKAPPLLFLFVLLNQFSRPSLQLITDEAIIAICNECPQMQSLFLQK